ncbi:MAG: NAD-binding protein [Magnetococcus sp. YQC-5]
MKQSSTYRRIKQYVYWVMEDPSCPYQRWYHFFMMGALLCSLGVMIINAHDAHVPAKVTTPLHLFFVEVENWFNFLFLCEYLLRWWTSTSFGDDYRLAVNLYRRRVDRPFFYVEILDGIFHAVMNKFRWMMHPLAMIDLLAVLPGFRFFRILRVLQFLKFFRYSRRIAFVTGIIGERRYEMISLIFAGLVIWGTVATAFFLAEHGINDKVNTFGSAIYWAIITITTVGYGDIAPVTDMGRAIASLGVLTGMSVTVLMTSLVVSVFTDRLFNLKEFHMEQQIAKLRNHFIVCGLNVLGQVACQSLHNEQKPFVAIDMDGTLVDRAIRQGWIAIRGDVNEKETWERAGLSRASSVIISILNEATNVYIILMVRELKEKCFVVACGGQQSSEQRLLRVGADRVILPYQNAGQQMAQTALRPSALQFLRLALDQTHVALEMEEIPIESGTIFDGVTLRDSDLRHGYEAIVIGVIEDGKNMVFNPQAKHLLKSGDVIICLGHKDDMERLKRASRRMAADHLLVGQELAEIWIHPDSPFDGVSVEDLAIRERFNVLLLAVAKGGKDVLFVPDSSLRISSGDVLISLGHRGDLDLLRVAAGDANKIPLAIIGLELEKMRITLHSPLHGVLLRNSIIRSGFLCNVVAVHRPGESLLINPSADFRCFANDLLICLGHRADLTRLKTIITKK